MTFLLGRGQQFNLWGAVCLVRQRSTALLDGEVEVSGTWNSGKRVQR